jgi:hypothetical protein
MNSYLFPFSISAFGMVILVNPYPPASLLAALRKVVRLDNEPGSALLSTDHVYRIGRPPPPTLFNPLILMSLQKLTAGGPEMTGFTSKAIKGLSIVTDEADEGDHAEQSKLSGQNA